MAHTVGPGHDVESENLSNLVTIVSLAVVAYAADVVHEFTGHALVAELRGVRVLSISSVAIQTVLSSRVVAAAGTIADIVAGVIAFALLARKTRFDEGHYCLWLFGFVSFMNSGYLIFSGVLDSGDWAVVVAGLNPPWAWRLGITTAGVILYTAAIWVAARIAIGWVSAGEVSIADIRRLTVSSYVAGGILLVLASALNPIGFRLVAISGVGASFGLTWGLLLIPGMVASHAGAEPGATKALKLRPFWAAVALLVGVAFVCVLGPGIRLSR
jgi:hypothetical protein